MIPSGTILKKGQEVYKMRNGKLISYRKVVIITVMSDKFYNYADKNRSRMGKPKTGYLDIEKSTLFYLTKFDFLKSVENIINIHKNTGRDITPDGLYTKQVLEELEAHRRNYPEYWI